MTTYPLSEPATIYAAGEGSAGEAVFGHGTLGDCAETLKGLSSEQRAEARIEMNDIDLQFGSREIDELLAFLEQEGEGLSSARITQIPENRE